MPLRTRRRSEKKKRKSRSVRERKRSNRSQRRSRRSRQYRATNGAPHIKRDDLYTDYHNFLQDALDANAALIMSSELEWPEVMFAFVVINLPIVWQMYKHKSWFEQHAHTAEGGSGYGNTIDLFNAIVNFIDKDCQSQFMNKEEWPPPWPKKSAGNGVVVANKKSVTDHEVEKQVIQPERDSEGKISYNLCKATYVPTAYKCPYCEQFISEKYPGPHLTEVETPSHICYFEFRKPLEINFDWTHEMQQALNEMKLRRDSEGISALIATILAALNNAGISEIEGVLKARDDCTGWYCKKQEDGTILCSKTGQDVAFSFSIRS